MGDEKSVGGGVIILVNEKFAKEPEVTEQGVVPGRIVRINVSFANTIFKIWSVHNYSMSQAAWRVATRMLPEDLQEDSDNRNISATLVLGDWN